MNKKTFPVVLPSNAIYLTFTLIGFLSFAVPFSLGHPQILVGTIVNASLFLAAMLLPSKFVLPIVFSPSLAVISRGLVFGPFTPLLILMAPFIWLANWLLVAVFKKIFSLKESYWLGVLGATILKVSFLYASAFIMFKLKLLPKIFLTTMGPLQLMTAFLGGAIAFLIKKAYKTTQN